MRERGRRKVIISLILILAVVLISLIGPYFLKDPNRQDILMMRKPPSEKYLLGTDELGRDVLSRLIHGGRVTIYVGLVSTLIQLIIGTVLGAVAGYRGGVTDSIIMRIVDIIMCFPFFVIALCLSAILGPGIRNIILIISLLQWPVIARVVRAEVMKEKQSEYVMSARVLGASDRRILMRHIMPNTLHVILTSSIVAVSNAVLSEASLSYLNLGVKLPDASWGNMLSGAQNLNTLQNEPWRWIPPGVMIILFVTCINMMGNGLRMIHDHGRDR